MDIRVASPADLPVLQDIERAAGQPFRKIGMPEIAEHAPPSLAILAHYQEAGRAWVIAEPAGGPVAYLLARHVDGNLHIEQVSVHPRFACAATSLASIKEKSDVPGDRLTYISP